MKLTDKLAVFYHDRKVGELTMTPDHTRCAFQYTKNTNCSSYNFHFLIKLFEKPFLSFIMQFFIISVFNRIKNIIIRHN